MTTHTKRMWDVLLDMAEGRGTDETSAHVSTCNECQEALSQIQQMLQAAALPHFAVPAGLAESVYGLMPDRVRRLSILQSSLQLSGARAVVTDDFQVVYAVDDLKLRVMYSPVRNGWEVFTVLPDATFTAERDGQVLLVDEDLRLQFIADDLTRAGFTLSQGDAHFEVPSPSEVQLGAD
ncbi:MAG TPA: hypothetical protein VK171_05955 [Fimbriimonas sp.]|nr:hypothetical protein [Fimbriimonas sp.]